MKMTSWGGEDINKKLKAPEGTLIKKCKDYLSSVYISILDASDISCDAAG